MKAFVLHGPHDGRVEDVDPPEVAEGEVLVDVERVGVCGTDVEFFTGQMAYLHTGDAAYPMRLGHEWTGRVTQVGGGVESAWIGRRVIGDTMLGCGQCSRCRRGFQHVCDNRVEVGVRRGRPGALAEQIAVPVSSVHVLPETTDEAAGALVEPGANALRAVDGAALREGERLLVIGPGTIGLLCAMHAKARGLEVLLMGQTESSVAFARDVGFKAYGPGDALPDVPFDAVIDATNDASTPALAVELVEPGRRVVYIGLAPAESLVDTRVIALKDVTAVGVLSGSPALDATIKAYADGSVDPRPLVAATVALDDVAEVLRGGRNSEWRGGPKVHVDPRQ